MGVSSASSRRTYVAGDRYVVVQGVDMDVAVQGLDMDGLTGDNGSLGDIKND